MYDLNNFSFLCFKTQEITWGILVILPFDRGISDRYTPLRTDKYSSKWSRRESVPYDARTFPAESAPVRVKAQ